MNSKSIRSAAFFAKITLLLACLFLVIFAGAVTSQAQIIVQGVYHSNSGDQQMNPNNQPNATSAVNPQINPCMATSGFTGTNCGAASSSNQFPQPKMTFTVAAPYNTSSYNISWSLVSKYNDPHGLLAYDTYGSTVPGNQSFSPQLSDGSSSGYGGNVIVQAQAMPTNVCTRNNPTGQISFTLWGVNQNSTQLSQAAVSASNTYTNGTASWFLPYMLGQESQGKQFNPNNGHPTYGSPDGVGVAQVDRVADPEQFYNTYPYWSFVDNLNSGMQVLAAKKQSTSGPCLTAQTEVTNAACEHQAYYFWDRQVFQACVASGGSGTALQSGGPGTEYCNVNTMPIPVYNGASLGNCSAAATWNTSNPSHHFQDLLWIQSYNGAAVFFVSWNQSAKQWQFNSGAGTYVYAVCNHAAAY